MLKKILVGMMILLASLIINGCFLQPVSVHEKEFNFVNMEAVTRLAKPVKAELLAKNEKGEWVSIGKGELPAGAYVRGKKPVETIETK